MTVIDALAGALLIGGCGFFFAGTVGLLRFPDALSRLHALTKADNLGLMLICASMALQSRSVQTTAMLGLLWLLALVASTVSAHLIARRALAGVEASSSDARDAAPASTATRDRG
jgi:multicomponent Na+:H+ antiporter subunit G